MLENLGQAHKGSYYTVEFVTTVTKTFCMKLNELYETKWVVAIHTKTTLPTTGWAIPWMSWYPCYVSRHSGCTGNMKPRVYSMNVLRSYNGTSLVTANVTMFCCLQNTTHNFEPTFNTWKKYTFVTIPIGDHGVTDYDSVAQHSSEYGRHKPSNQPYGTAIGQHSQVSMVYRTAAF